VVNGVSERFPDDPFVQRALPPAPELLAAGLDPASQGGAWTPPEEPTLALRRYVSAVLRRKWLIAALTLMGTGAGFFLSRRVPRRFQAQATLWIQVGQNQQSGPIQGGQLLQWSSWVDLLQSFVVLDQVVREKRLFLQPESQADSAVFTSFQLGPQFAPGPYRLVVRSGGRTFALYAGDQIIQRGNVGDSVGNKVGFSWVPDPQTMTPGRTVQFRVRTPRDAALALRAGMKAILDQQGSFLRIELTGSDAKATASILNAITARFVDVAAQLKRQKLATLSEILKRQLTSSYNDLGRAENALESFRMRTITQPSEQPTVMPTVPGAQMQAQDPAVRAFFALQLERDQAERDRVAIDSALAQPDSNVAVMALEAIPSVQKSQELSQALSQLVTKEADARSKRLLFADTYPELRQLNADIADLRHHTIPTLARNLSAQLAGRVREMDGQIGTSSRQLRAIPARSIELARLNRNRQIAEQLYTNLEQRYEEARLAEVSSIPDVRILDPAVTPERPLADKAMMLLFGGFAGSLGAGVGLALLLDRFDRRVRYPEQVSLEMGLPILGVVPRLRNGNRRAGPQTEAPVVEALRAIRLNLEHAYGAAGPLVTTITSPGAGDGKSFLASNLAVAFADAGQRTILIDGDIRRGQLHRIFGVDRKPGLLDYLTGEATREAIVRPTAIKGVEFIGGGTRLHAGPELLASSAMSQLLINLRSTYGVVIVDCAPLGAGVDPMVMGTLTGSLVVVLRTGVTDREFATAKIEGLSRLPIRVLGAVLNDVKPGDSYGTYSYYGYLPGYETSEEEDAAGVRRLPRGSKES
jgi:succinoglycan biosynthesis transport protein ExoP